MFQDFIHQEILLNKRKLQTSEKRIKALQDAEKQAEEEAILKEERLKELKETEM